MDGWVAQQLTRSARKLLGLPATVTRTPILAPGQSLCRQVSGRPSGLCADNDDACTPHGAPSPAPIGPVNSTPTREIYGNGGKARVIAGRVIWVREDFHGFRDIGDLTAGSSDHLPSSMTARIYSISENVRRKLVLGHARLSTLEGRRLTPRTRDRH